MSDRVRPARAYAVTPIGRLRSPVREPVDEGWRG
jgi:hypothetical protein